MIFIWIRIGPVANCCEYDEPLVSINSEEFLDKLRDYQILKQYSAPWT